MDVLLMLTATVRATGYDGSGDFMMDPVGKLMHGPSARRPYVFTGVQILHPRIFEDAPSGRLSMNVLYDRALEAGRLHGMAHDGEWYHVGTPDAIRSRTPKSWKKGRPSAAAFLMAGLARRAPAVSIQYAGAAFLDTLARAS